MRGELLPELERGHVHSLVPQVHGSVPYIVVLHVEIQELKPITWHFGRSRERRQDGGLWTSLEAYPTLEVCGES